MNMKFLIIFICALMLIHCDFDYNNPVDPDFDLKHPGMLALSQDGEWIRLNWSENDQYTTGYRIMRKSGDEEWSKLADIKDTNQLTYLDTTSQTNVYYSYRICGLADANKSEFSSEPSMKVEFTAPYQIEGTAQSENSIHLTWHDSCDFGDGYRIYRKGENESQWVNIGNVNHQYYFADEGLVYNKEYKYYLIGYTNHNESLKSAEYSSKIQVETPTELNAYPLTDHEIRLSWKDNSLFENGYIIERRAGVTDSWAEMDEVDENQTSWIDSTVFSDKFYAYRIKAFSENYESEFSNQISAKTEFPAPINLKVNSINNYSAKISWSDTYSYETSYIFQYVIKDQTDTITIPISAEINEYTLEDIYEDNIYNIIIKAKTELNVSQALMGTIGFSDTFTWMDQSELSGNRVNSIDFSSDGLSMVLGREDNTSDIFNMDSWSLIQSIEGNPGVSTANVVDVDFAHDNPWLAVGTNTGFVRILNNDGWAEVDTLYLNAYPLTSCQFSTDDSYLALAQYKFIYLWNTSDWSFSSTLSEHTEQITEFDFSPDGSWLASGANDDQIIIWSTSNWNDLYTLDDHTDNITDVSFSPNSQYLASGSADGEVRIWSTNNWTESTLLTTEVGSIKALAFSNNGKWLAVASGETGTIKLWSTDGWIEFPGPTGISKAVTALKYTPDDSYLVAALADGSVSIWNLEGAWKVIEN